MADQNRRKRRAQARSPVDIAQIAALIDRGAHEEALRLSRDGLAANPNAQELLEAAGVAAVMLARWDLARRYFVKLTGLAADDVRHWMRLGYILFSSGDMKGASKAYAAAIERAPGEPEFRVNRALCEVRLGNLDAAETLFQAALKLAPSHPGALQGLSNIYREIGQPFEAMGYLRRLAETDQPRGVDFWVEYGELAMSTYDVPDVRRALAQASEPAAGDANLSARLAHLWNRIGEPEKALACVRRARSLAPDDAEIANEEATMNIDAGDTAAAAAIYRENIERHPDHASSYFGLSQVVKFSADVPDHAALVETMEAALKRRLSDPVFVHFGLAKAYNELKDPVRAFEHAKRGNASRFRQYPYAPARDRTKLAALKAAYRAGGFDTDVKPVAAGAPSPIFITGMPRSGTTLVEQFLGAHPLVAACGEMMLLPFVLATHCPAADALPATPQAARIGEIYRAQLAALTQGKPRGTDKLPSNIWNVGAILSAMPDARVIIMERDPLDVGLSCYFSLFRRGVNFTFDLASIGAYQRMCDDIAAHWLAVFGDRVLRVRYEDLIADPDAGMRRVLDYCGLEWHPDVARFFEVRRRVGTASFNQVNQPIYSTSVGRWHAYESQLKPLIDALADKNEAPPVAGA